MAATIQIHEMYAVDSGADKTSGTVRMRVTDVPSVNTDNPIVVPASGTTAYSYSKKVRPFMEDPPDTNVQNFRWYMDGSNDFGSGIEMEGKGVGTTWAANFIVPLSDGADLFSYTGSAVLDGDAVDTGPFTSADSGTYIADLIEFQMSVASSATNGSLSGEDMTLAFDEI